MLELTVQTRRSHLDLISKTGQAEGKQSKAVISRLHTIISKLQIRCIFAHFQS